VIKENVNPIALKVLLWNTFTSIKFHNNIIEFFINLTRYHFIYWHTTIDYTYSNIIKKQSKVVLCNFVKNRPFFFGTPIMNAPLKRRKKYPSRKDSRGYSWLSTHHTKMSHQLMNYNKS
jgi:hypothetical protein